MHYLENELSAFIALDGLWQFKLSGHPEQTLSVPSAWEGTVGDKVSTGPARYRRTFMLPDSWLGHLIYLEAQAISYATTVYVNGNKAGEHLGMWTPFQLDLSPYLRSGENRLEIVVYKPGYAADAGYPLRETLAGFLPDVATAFGGIWQSIGLRRVPVLNADSIKISAQASGAILLEGQLDAQSLHQLLRGRLEVIDAQGQSTISDQVQMSVNGFRAAIQLKNPALWWPRSDANPSAPLYHLKLTLFDAKTSQPVLALTRRFGFRTVEAQGGKLWLNHQPLHLRGVLDWGWDAERLCPTPTRAQVQAQFAQARALGFNMVKLCLFVPDETTFDVADEEGMLLWLELPMWLPHVTPEFKALALREYAAILQRVQHHPSIVAVSLGCELNQQADAAFLGELDTLARTWLPNALHCDNSGSAEAYGGVLTALSDFYDYHFYTDPHFFQPLVDHFSRPYLPAKPWVYGEFCDADTLRDFSRLPSDTWWLRDSLSLEREELTWMREHAARLSAAGIHDGGQELTHLARQQATAVRKFICEQVRSRQATGGYVITGWKDTPIATSGVVDDAGELKFAPGEWRQFNNQSILFIDRERRRRWRGGDRPVHQHPCAWWQDDTAEIHLGLSNGSGDIRRGHVEWALHDAGEDLRGEFDVPALPGGEVVQLTTLHLPPPSLSNSPAALRERMLSVQATLQWADGNQHMVTNTWPLWVAPPKEMCLNAVQGQSAHVYDHLSAEVLAAAMQGGTHIVGLRHHDEALTRSMPFWREAIHVFQPHPFWQALGNPTYADMRFYSVATDFALDIEKLMTTMGIMGQVYPLWRRFDARAMTWADYLVEVRPALGKGRLYISSLRFAGGLGDQPDTLDTNPVGAWMLAALLQ
jgi:hypothetical protein